MAYLTYRAIRAAAAKPPEDFIMRVDPGIDEATRERLARGLRIIRSMRRLERLAYAILGAGLVIVIGGAILSNIPTLPVKLYPWIFPAMFASFGLAAIAFLVSLGISFAHRVDLRRVYAFWEAMQGSSLARDLA